ncbi:MAG: 5-amino-6-(D-ribitylamino)uracil--L-tyrosine 4-hydroxyphenyl transferase CofH [Alphaproteobacteria bacterium]|nr:5-amino-6-(D-ribitylamino)uracil--L-tyrosine 4-hydroxyphenyl transferase CofH [Alphaproteobacteria bacterium]
MNVAINRLPDFERPDRETALALEDQHVAKLQPIAAAFRDQGHGALITYSRKVFIPLTKLCRNVCHYCTFARAPAKGSAHYLMPEQILAIARAGAEAGCQEALFTLGDKPELRYAASRTALVEMGYESTLSYLIEMARLVYAETGLLPHINAGVMDAEALRGLRSVSVSQGLMLEASSLRLCEPGGPHHGSPDKDPAQRLAMIAAAGELRIPFTSGILIGIGETRRERIEALLALRDLNDRYGHLQEVIIQNFRRKPGTRMARAPEPSLEDLCWTIAVARILFGPEANIQAPPNLSPQALKALIDAGINDFGGVSPVTADHVNPEAPWPQLERLAAETEAAGKILVPRLPIQPAWTAKLEDWVDVDLRPLLRKAMDSSGLARLDAWSPGDTSPPPALPRARSSNLGPSLGSALSGRIDRAQAGGRLSEAEVTSLFGAHGRDFRMLCAAADELRAAVSGRDVTYVPNCNLNYTNVCSYKCRFCAFAKGRMSESLRGAAYTMSLDEIQDKVREAWTRGAVEVCVQGGIHPSYTGQIYLDICRAIKAVCPGMHIHAFSPLEVWYGAKTLALSPLEFLSELRAAGLGSLPGTAAEILDDEVRAVICPDKVSVAEWCEVIRSAHRIGVRSTATIMFGHVERPVHWARHLLCLRDLQEETGGFTEFVPLPFVPMEAPMARRGQARIGPTFRETVLMHAVARLVLNPLIPNIQTSWVKLGAEGVSVCLQSGANDLGGTLMHESISRAAGGGHGEEMTPRALDTIIERIGRVPTQRDSLYGRIPRGRYLSQGEYEGRCRAAAC